MQFQNFKKNASVFLLCIQTETAEVWTFFFRKLYLGVLHFQIQFFIHITFPKQVIAIYYNIVIGAFQWKTGIFSLLTI